MTNDDNGEKKTEKMDDVDDLLGREIPEMKVEQRGDSKGLRDVRFLSLLCWEIN